MNPPTDESPRMTAAEWQSLSAGRNTPPPAPAKAKPPENLIKKLIPNKFSETGAQMTYLGIAGLIGVGVIALGGDAIDVIPIDLGTATAAFTALMGGGGIYRQANKRHTNSVETGVIDDDFGAVDDYDLGGPDR